MPGSPPEVSTRAAPMDIHTDRYRPQAEHGTGDILHPSGMCFPVMGKHPRPDRTGVLTCPGLDAAAAEETAGARSNRTRCYRTSRASCSRRRQATDSRARAKDFRNHGQKQRRGDRLFPPFVRPSVSARRSIRPWMRNPSAGRTGINENRNRSSGSSNSRTLGSVSLQPGTGSCNAPGSGSSNNQ